MRIWGWVQVIHEQQNSNQRTEFNEYVEITTSFLTEGIKQQIKKILMIKRFRENSNLLNNTLEEIRIFSFDKSNSKVSYYFYWCNSQIKS